MNRLFLKSSIDACLSNGERILSDALMLECPEPPATAYALAIISQEEFAKAFLLALVYKEIIEWNQFIWRASRDHTCKQLLIMVMDYINPDEDEWDKCLQAIVDGGTIDRTLPSHVADAINIFRYEKIGKWQSKNWFWENAPKYDLQAKKISEGLVDRKKQDQIYIDLAKDGSVIYKKPISSDQFYIERNRAERLSRLVKGVIKDETGPYFGYKKISEMFNLMFMNLTQDKQKES